MLLTRIIIELFYHLLNDESYLLNETFLTAIPTIRPI